jgi:transposase-like protein
LVEEMLIERGLVVLYETIRRWGKKFGPDYTADENLVAVKSTSRRNIA